MWTPFYYFVGIFSWPARALYRLQARGRENLPADGGFVLAANHISALDPWAVGFPLWPKRRLRWMAKIELFRNRLQARLLRWGGAFPVRRGGHDQTAVQTAIGVVRQGHVLVMFPEGTRRRPGRDRPRPHTGAARIALAAGVPLVPAAVAGTDRLSRLARWRVLYGPPLQLEDLDGLDRRRAAARATERLIGQIHALESELTRR